MSKYRPYLVYAVHKGAKPGIYDTWEECEEQVEGYAGAVFRKFSRTDMELAEKFVRTGNIFSDEPKEYVRNSLSVDAACSDNPGEMEYQIVRTDTGKKLFGSRVYPVGTNNLGEFLAVVKALQYLTDIEEKDTIVYSDSVSAIAWVRNGKVNSALNLNDSTRALWHDVYAALDWLHHNHYTNPVVKWETHLWGESKADFGRK